MVGKFGHTHKAYTPHPGSERRLLACRNLFGTCWPTLSASPTDQIARDLSVVLAENMVLFQHLLEGCCVRLFRCGYSITNDIYCQHKYGTVYTVSLYTSGVGELLLHTCDLSLTSQPPAHTTVTSPETNMQ